MNSKIVAGPRRSRATIMEEVARALRDADASTNIESAIARTGIHARVTSAVDLLLNGALATHNRFSRRPHGVQAPPSAL